jgi:DNA invertase Pin-like site-specific DNA recombinase
MQAAAKQNSNERNPAHSHSKMRVKVANIGYARVSSTDQGFDGQIERLQAAGCTKIFAEKLSGKSTNGRHELAKAFRTLRPGDVLVITKLDQLARSIRDLLNIIDQLKAGGVMLKALDDTWLDTTSPHGELIVSGFYSLLFPIL